MGLAIRESSMNCHSVGLPVPPLGRLGPRVGAGRLRRPGVGGGLHGGDCPFRAPGPLAGFTEVQNEHI
jgi:hypothetical protein